MQRATINDFVIRFANVNGTGSASANSLVAKCLFRMGLPIGPKNMFPSNIQGMPTWYEIRVSERGFTGRRGGVDLMAAFNGQTLAQDSREVSPGGYLIYDSTRFLSEGQRRKDISYLDLPITDLARREFTNARQRSLLQNMIYVGAVASLLQLDLEVLLALTEQQYRAKPKLIPLNHRALQMGFAYAREHFPSPLPFHIHLQGKRPLAEDAIMLEGNKAIGLGCLYAGATVAGWYPITPSTSVVEAFQSFCHKYRVSKTPAGEEEKQFCVIQAEDEIAALGIVMGATWNGARAFTATSGPGISLMTELLGFAYYAEVPAVIFNIQRCGPSTGMPTRTQQADLLLCAYASHGDTKHLLLFPANPAECFDFATRAFDLAEKYQTPVMVLSDLEIGMNEYVSKPLSWQAEGGYERGKVLRAEDLQALQKPFFRYLDEDGDGIPKRTLPGDHPRGAYFTRGSGHDKLGRYTEDGAAYCENLDRITRKFETAVNVDLPQPLFQRCEQEAKMAVLYFGSTEEALREALAMLGDEGLFFDSLRVRAFPFHESLRPFFARYEKVLVVEQNRDGQLRKLLLAEEIAAAKQMTSVLCYDGMPLQATVLVARIKEAL